MLKKKVEDLHINEENVKNINNQLKQMINEKIKLNKNFIKNKGLIY